MAVASGSRSLYPLYLPFLFALPILIALMLTSPQERAVKEKCDEAVATLLQTGDRVELERVSILIRELRCSVARRLPRS